METRALEVVVGLGGIFLIYSLLVTQIVEMLSGLLSSRAIFLERGIRALIGEALTGQLLRQPFFKALAVNAKGLPSYLEPDTFGQVLLTIIGNKADGGVVTLDRASVPPEAAGVLKTIFDGGPLPIAEAEARLANAYRQVMDRVSGLYKRYARLAAFFVSLLLVVVTNQDALQTAQTLWTRPSVSQAAAIVAQKQLEQCKHDGGRFVCPAAISDITTPQLHLWSMAEVRRFSASDWIVKVIGLLLTTIAIALGAPFWFDLLTRIAPGLRLAGPLSPAAPAAEDNA